MTAGWWTDWDGFPTLRATHEIKMTTWIMQNANNSPEIKAEFETRMHTIRTGEATGNWRAF
ncbi:hypothetical protein FHX82_001156 [Amycolatopsis bartoniae]|uniref:Uncharacterized protein n=1 Tax=Amycolatopsis bartoniae TaxID=941986 RepID=A0A8H9IYG9_9PSEU|nr:hypothetical protein [Amycolatopsis bartoniae]MBB2934136.1 hypothetical protein [Amycolatopsis bartoniae]TVT05515.1 hypothetical protein FNH07_22830 [Amycolatopsis bartoniae]GHF84102.1 hypothetical protein GCM10017566_67640 [Amycolatopsis bartoniae]